MLIYKYLKILSEFDLKNYSNNTPKNYGGCICMVY